MFSQLPLQKSGVCPNKAFSLPYIVTYFVYRKVEQY